MEDKQNEKRPKGKTTKMEDYILILYHYPTNSNPLPIKEFCPPLIVGDLPHFGFRELCHTLALESCV